MNIVLITTGRRTLLLSQSIDSLISNAVNWSQHTMTVVSDGRSEAYGVSASFEEPAIIINPSPQGASASRNIGAGSIPKYRRQEHILFLDDDVWLAPGYDNVLLDLSRQFEHYLISSYGHPFNQEQELAGATSARFPLVLSSVCMFMSWSAWDEIGFWTEPGGAGASEDFEYCARAAKLGYGFAVSNPHACIHTGLCSSRGDRIVGYDLLEQQNKRLEKLYGVEGKIQYAKSD